MIRILTEEIDIGFGFDTERNNSGQLLLKILHIPAEIDIENMIKNICDLGYAAEGMQFYELIFYFKYIKN